MAFQPIYGYSGNHPVLDYNSNIPVCMEPFPYTPGAPVNGWVYGSEILTLNQNTVRVTTSTSGSFFADASIYYLYTGTATRTATLTYSLPDGHCEATVTRLVGSSGVSGGHAYWSSYDYASGSSTNLTIPYYRYGFSIFLNGYAATAGDWVQVTIS